MKAQEKMTLSLSSLGQLQLLSPGPEQAVMLLLIKRSPLDCPDNRTYLKAIITIDVGCIYCSAGKPLNSA